LGHQLLFQSLEVVFQPYGGKSHIVNEVRQFLRISVIL
jgi:hypothetical protein